MFPWGKNHPQLKATVLKESPNWKKESTNSARLSVLPALHSVYELIVCLLCLLKMKVFLGEILMGSFVKTLQCVYVCEQGSHIISGLLGHGTLVINGEVPSFWNLEEGRRLQTVHEVTSEIHVSSNIKLDLS